MQLLLRQEEECTSACESYTVGTYCENLHRKKHDKYFRIIILLY